MAAVAKLNYTDTGASGVNLSFLDDSGLYITSPGWIPKITQIGIDGLPTAVAEQIELWVNGTSYDDVATIEQSLADMMRMTANYWSDPDREVPVWLHSQLSGETNERRALVRAIAMAWLTEHYSQDMVSFKPRLKAAIERFGGWEQTTESTYKETSGISSTGGLNGLYDYTAAPAADVVGTLPSRLNYLITWANSASMSVFWAGIRSEEKHTLGSYDPVFTFAADFTPGTDAADVVDATAKDGNRMNITFATATWASRATNGGGAIGDGTSPGESGDHLILLRAKVDAGTVADVKLSFSNISVTENVTYTGVQRISATSWTIYPLDGLFNNSDRPDLTMWARRVSGSGDLDIDCLIFIPVDSFFLFAEGTNVIGTNASAGLQIFTRPDGVEQAYSASLAERVSNVQMVGPGIPVGDGRMVICAARTDRVSVLTDTLTIKMNHWPRWASLRGNE